MKCNIYLDLLRDKSGRRNAIASRTTVLLSSTFEKRNVSRATSNLNHYPGNKSQYTNFCHETLAFPDTPASPERRYCL